MHDIDNVAYFAHFRRVPDFHRMAQSPGGAFSILASDTMAVEDWMRGSSGGLKPFYYVTVPGTWKTIRELTREDIEALQDEFRPTFKDYAIKGWSRLPGDICYSQRGGDYTLEGALKDAVDYFNMHCRVFYMRLE